MIAKNGSDKPFRWNLHRKGLLTGDLVRHIARRFMRMSAITALFTSTILFAASSKGFIHGTAEAGSQIVVISLDTGTVIGIVAAADGTYRTDELDPGRYRIAEKGRYHAPREVLVVAGKAADVDLSASGK